MNKNTNKDFQKIADMMTEAYGDMPVQMTFRDVKEGMDSFFGMMGLTSELIRLIRKESELKKHHRAYLHVREEIDKCVAEAADHIAGIIDDLSEKEHIYHVVHDGEDFPFAVVDEDDDEDGMVVIAKSDYDGLIEDILTLAELVTVVTEMRTRDLKSINELSKFIPAFAAFERNRISVYKDARFEADEIIDRLDEMEEPYEYFSD